MRILFVDINAAFLNPTRSLILPALMEVGDVHAFGPGFVSSKTLVRGLSAYVDQAGPFDVAITNTHILFADAYSAPVSPAQFARSYCFAFPSSDVLALPRIASEFDRMKKSREPSSSVYLRFWRWSTAVTDAHCLSVIWLWPVASMIWSIRSSCTQSL